MDLFKDLELTILFVQFRKPLYVRPFERIRMFMETRNERNPYTFFILKSYALIQRYPGG
jgi:hypothetical protein